MNTLCQESQNGREFVCIECGEKVILKRGDVRRPHFAHYHNSSHNTCSYYTRPRESQIHKNAKHKLALFLRQRRAINIYGNALTKTSDLAKTGAKAAVARE